MNWINIKNFPRLKQISFDLKTCFRIWLVAVIVFSFFGFLDDLFLHLPENVSTPIALVIIGVGLLAFLGFFKNLVTSLRKKDSREAGMRYFGVGIATLLSFFVVLTTLARIEMQQNLKMSLSPSSTTPSEVLSQMPLTNMELLASHEFEADAFLHEINSQRKKENVSDLTIDSNLAPIAQALADQIAEQGRADISISWDKLDPLFEEYIPPYKGNLGRAINLAQDVFSPAGVVNLWVNNGQTKEAVIDPLFKWVAFARANNKDNPITIAVFIAPMNEEITVAANKPVNSTNPIVNCIFPETGTLKLPKDKCDQMIDCEVTPGKYQAVYKSDCDNVMKSLAVRSESIVSDKQINCVIDGQTYSGTKEECEEAQRVNQWSIEYNRKHAEFLAEYEATSRAERERFEQWLRDFNTRQDLLAKENQEISNQALEEMQRKFDEELAARRKKFNEDLQKAYEQAKKKESIYICVTPRCLGGY